MTEPIVFHPIMGAPPSIEWVAVSALLIDEAYQRSIESPASARLIMQIACHWDWRLFSPLTVSKRNDNDLYVLDGQHRLEAAKLRADIPHLPVVVSRYENVESEARAFVAVNTARKNPTALDKFNARCVSGDTEALEIRQMVEDTGLKIGRSSYSIKDNEICCVAVLTRLFKQYGKKILSASLVNISEAWPGEPMRVANEMLPGLCLLLYQTPEDFDPDLLTEVLKGRRQIAWFAGSKSAENSDPDAEWPDEVFRDIVLDAYLSAQQRQAAQ